MDYICNLLFIFIYIYQIISGPGKLITMLTQLQRESDRQARKIIEKFKQFRDFDRKVSNISLTLMLLVANLAKTK